MRENTNEDVFVIICPWGNPFKKLSGAQVRTSTIIELIKSISTRVFLVTLDNISNKPVWVSVCKLFSYKGRGGLVLDINPFYYLSLVKIAKFNASSKIFIVLEGPTGILGALFLKMLRSNIFVCYDAHNVEIERMRQDSLFVMPKILKVTTKLVFSVLEFVAVKYSDCIISISWEDKKKFGYYYNVIQDKIFPVYPVLKLPDKSKKPLISEKKYKIRLGVVFHGSYGYLPNREAIEIISKVSQKFPFVDFYIAGSDVPRLIRDNLKFLGFIRNLDDFLELGDIALAPITRGAGIKLKIVDYLSRGLPVITTVTGSEGLLLTSWRNVVILDSTEISHITYSLERLIFNPKLRKKIGYMGKVHAFKLLNPKNSLKSLKRAIDTFKS